MIVSVESLAVFTANNNKTFWSFSVRFRDVVTNWFLTMSGWRYMPETRKISSPGAYWKGTNHNLTTQHPELRDEIWKQVEEYLGVAGAGDKSTLPLGEKKNFEPQAKLRKNKKPRDLRFVEEENETDSE